MSKYIRLYLYIESRILVVAEFVRTWLAFASEEHKTQKKQVV